jgi:hypothetical protein
MARKKEPLTEQMERSHFANAPAQFLDKLEATNRRWFERMQSEAALASEFASKFTMARSIPDAVTACQDWASWRFEMMAEDRDHLLADYQMFTEAGAHFLWNSWQLNSSAVSAEWRGADRASLFRSALVSGDRSEHV